MKEKCEYCQKKPAEMEVSVRKGWLSVCSACYSKVVPARHRVERG